MTSNVRIISFPTLIIFGLIIFFLNLYNLEFNNENLIPLDKKDYKKVKENIRENLVINQNNLVKQNIELNKENSVNDLKKIIVKIKKGQTFLQILNNFDLDRSKQFELIDMISESINLRNLKVDQEIIFFIDQNEELKQLIIEIDFTTNLVVSLGPQIIIEKKNLKTYSVIESKEYHIANSLYSDGIKNNLPNPILIKLIQLFSFDIDFQRDIRKNTQVSVSYEATTVENKLDQSYGDISYAKIKINNNTLEYFKFITDDGFVDYFNREGKNVKKSILKTPLDGAKISSNFGMRKHPISGFNKMHKGVDFAAPIGTPVYAGGNGVIEFAGRNGGYGKYLRIRHNNNYKTAYAHLHGFKKGIMKGTRVNQGEVIGYVGNTGRSTGPHLHYEIIYKNEQINPLTLKLPSGKILEGQELERFKINYKTILANHLNNLFE